jgi:hypothetical protein
MVADLVAAMQMLERLPNRSMLVLDLDPSRLALDRRMLTHMPTPIRLEVDMVEFREFLKLFFCHE